jgi:subtilisin family serine protease
MKKLRLLVRCSVLTVTLAASGFAAGDLLLRVDPSAIDSVVRQHGLKIEKKLDSSSGVYVVSVVSGQSPAAVLQALKSNSQVRNVEVNQRLALTKRPASPQQAAKAGRCAPTALVDGKYRYTSQNAVAIVCLADAQKQFGGGSAGVHVAVIDTAIDYNHPVLAGVLDAGYDAIQDRPGPVNVNQETSPFVDQETSPFVDSAGNVVVNQETSPFVDQETSPFVDQETSPFVDKIPPGYGHGTMVAGIVHLVAPNVRIVPVRAFDDNGSGAMADVIEAINWAVANGADVINMSFSAPVYSAELDSAIQNAVRNNVICVASVSNSHSTSPVFPAALSSVIGVGATDDTDTAASFTDYGAAVALAAPGVWIYSPYPNNAYAYSNGTSFATPFVAGSAALLKSLNRNTSPASVGGYLDAGTDPAKGFASKVGRLDVLDTDRAATRK